MLTIIVAMGRNRAIGRKGQLPWHIPEDLAHFKALTMGHTIIMGHRTFESLPHGALPGRRNIVVSRTVTSLPGCEVYSSINKIIALSSNGHFTPLPSGGGTGGEAAFAIGGASIYRQLLPYVSRIELTLVDTAPEDADTFFPELNPDEWTETKKEKHDGFSFISYIRTKPSLREEY